VKLLVERVDVDVTAGKLKITLHDLADELPEIPEIVPARAEEAAAE
jgi:hypothetical protein